MTKFRERIEVTNAHTGTLCTLNPDYFILIRPSTVHQVGAAENDPMVVRKTTLMSIFNPMVCIAVKEKYEDLIEVLK